MSHSFNPARLDLRAFAQAGEPLSGASPLAALERLAAEAAGDVAATVNWNARAEYRQPGVLTGVARADAPVLWLHLGAQAVLPLTCQRCLGPVDTPLEVDRWFRFVADEATAEAEDEEAEEDVLVFSAAFDLIALLEDELIMALPLVPLHDSCPVAVPMQAGEADVPAPAERPNPFAALAHLKKKG